MKAIDVSAPDYAELLGLYLGDGCISKLPRTYRLRITLDSKYPRIIRRTAELLEHCFPNNPINVVARQGCVDVSAYCSHLPCLLPQHGDGRKHERSIALEGWQQEILEQAPWPFIRACIWSDGCVFINRTDIHQPRPNEYLSFGFSNNSKDIVDLLVAACDRVGVITRANRDSRGRWSVRINRRASVALMLTHVGRKA
jgi:hypothetical protein